VLDSALFRVVRTQSGGKDTVECHPRGHESRARPVGVPWPQPIPVDAPVATTTSCISGGVAISIKLRSEARQVEQVFDQRVGDHRDFRSPDDRAQPEICRDRVKQRVENAARLECVLVQRLVIGGQA
jgi:hypothetical protein